jgi:hypothetical protein
MNPAAAQGSAAEPRQWHKPRGGINLPALHVGIVCAYVLPVLAPWPTKAAFGAKLRDVYLAAACAAPFAYPLLFVGLLAAIIAKWERLPLSSAGWKLMSLSEILPAIVGLFAAIGVAVVFDLTIQLIGISIVNTALDAWLKRAWRAPLWWRAASVAGDALVEECGRGYVIERVAALSGRYALGGVAALIGSMAMHTMGWGTQAVYAFLPGQTVLVLMYLWRRNVGTCWMTHSLMDGTALLIAPLFLT